MNTQNEEWRFTMQPYQRKEKTNASPKKKGGGKKPFVIESRFVDESKKPYEVMSWMKDWRKFSKYETEKQRDQALIDLQKKCRIGHNLRIEYRKV